MRTIIGAEPQMYALALARVGLIKPGMTKEGMEISTEDDAVLRDYIRMIRVEGYSSARALGLLLTRRPAATDPKGAETELVAEIVRLRDHFESFKQETKEIREALERERKESRERIRDLDEERQLSRLRMSRLEETLRRSKPVTLWDRIKAAFGVLKGETGVVHALPEWVESSREKKAA